MVFSPVVYGWLNCRFIGLNKPMLFEGLTMQNTYCLVIMKILHGIVTGDFPDYVLVVEMFF
jgi:hypothetical protein